MRFENTVYIKLEFSLIAVIPAFSGVYQQNKTVVAGMQIRHEIVFILFIFVHPNQYILEQHIELGLIQLD